MSTSHAPCAACKCRRQKCTQECVFEPYFPPDEPQRFINVHKVFGASNVAKLLNELSPNQRGDAVNSLVYEAQYRLRDPVYGCISLVSILQHKLRQVQHDLECAKKELAAYIGPSAMFPMLNHAGLLQRQRQNFGNSVYQMMMPYHLQQMMFPTEREMQKAYAPQQQLQLQQEGQRKDEAGEVGAATDFGQMAEAAAVQPSLALSATSYESDPNRNIQQHVHAQGYPHFQSQSHSHRFQLQQQQSLAQQQLVQMQASSHSQQQTHREKSVGISC